MSRLDNVIEEVKSFRKGENKPWIFDKNGNVKDDVLIVDVLPLLLALKECEIEISNAEIDEYLKKDYISAENTYNFGANISNDLDWKIYKNKNDENKYIALIMVHLFGDIRGGYSDYFAISIEEYKNFLEFLYYEDFYEETTKYVSFDKYYAEVDMFSDVYTVYDENDCDIGTFYEIDVKDLLNKIEKRKGE